MYKIKKNKYKKLLGFTLVELIVVITILAILATIGFVSFSAYLVGTRDTNRIAQLKSMSDALELYRTKKDLPLPDDKVDIKSGSNTIAYQGNIGKNVLETIEYTESGLDPKDKTYFSYFLTKNKKYFQLLSFLEESNEDIVAIVPNTSHLLRGEENKVNATDYSERYPKTTGNKLGIITDNNNIPIQNISSIISSGSLDITNTTDEYTLHFSDGSNLTGTGIKFEGIKKTLIAGGIVSSCKILMNKNINLSGKDGIYLVNPNGANPIQVYCDMTTDGGGWTMIANAIGEGTGVINHDDIVNWIPTNSNNCSLNNECISDVGTYEKNWDELMVYSRGYKIKGTKCNDKKLTIKGYSELTAPTISSHRPNNWGTEGASARGKCDELYELSQGLSISNYSKHDIYTNGVADPGNYPIKMGLNFVGNDTSETALISFGVTCTPQGLGTSKNGNNYKIYGGYGGLGNDAGTWQINRWDGASEIQQTWFIR